MIHIESWHVEAEALEQERLRLIQMLREREIDLEGFYHRMKRMETGQNLLESDEEGWLVITPAWVSVHRDWVEERLRQRKVFQDIEERLPDTYPEDRSNYGDYINWSHVFLGLSGRSGRDLNIGYRALVPARPGSIPQYTKDENAFNTWYREMLEFGKSHLDYLLSKVEGP